MSGVGGRWGGGGRNVLEHSGKVFVFQNFAYSPHDEMLLGAWCC